MSWECDENISPLSRMVNRVVAMPDAFFKSQQRNEPELTVEEKTGICLDLFHTKPATFLRRYGKYLQIEDTECFTGARETDYEINFFLQQIKERYGYVGSSQQRSSFKNQRDVKHLQKKQLAIIKNRRYAKLQELINGSEYFSDFEMRSRDPLLYEQMVGQYQTETENSEAFHSGEHSKTNLKLSTMLMDIHDKIKDNEEMARQWLEESCYVDSDGGESSGEDEMDTTECRQLQRASQTGKPKRKDSVSESEEEEETEEKPKIDPQDKARLRAEFIDLMHERFLTGQDDFDYSNVDYNECYDMLDIESADAEESYFDSEEPREISAEEAADKTENES